MLAEQCDTISAVALIIWWHASRLNNFASRSFYCDVIMELNKLCVCVCCLAKLQPWLYSRSARGITPSSFTLSLMGTVLPFLLVEAHFNFNTSRADATASVFWAETSASRAMANQAQAYH